MVPSLKAEELDVVKHYLLVSTVAARQIWTQFKIKVPLLSRRESSYKMVRLITDNILKENSLARVDLLNAMNSSSVIQKL